MEISCNLHVPFEGFQSMAYFRNETFASHIKQVLIVFPGYIYVCIYSPRFVTVCITTIHNDKDFEKGKQKI
jgi:molybdenum cofactor biosynthesis enzyme MoaA